MTISTTHQIDPFAHLSASSAARKPSPLTALRPHLSRPGMISLGGGYPHLNMFPIGNLSFDVLTPGSSKISQRTIGTGLTYPPNFVPSHLEQLKNKPLLTPTSSIDLYPFLQYGRRDGDERLLDFCRQLVKYLWNPPAPQWEVTMCAGGGAAIELVFSMLCNPGEWVLFDEFTHPATLECARSQGLKRKGVPADEEGMCPRALREVLSNWDEKDGKRPLVVYLIPSGQNPLSISQSAERRKAIYEVAADYHLCIIEDDPYGMICMDSNDGQIPTTAEQYLATLPPSYLSIDYHGRVIRIDSFSKLFAPGARLGWVTAHRAFIERLVRHAEVSVRQPSGLIQAIMVNTLVGEPGQPGWGVQGWLEWCFELSKKYRARRDVMCDALDRLIESPVGKGRLRYLKPMCGMFLVVSVDLERHPRFVSGEKRQDELLSELFQRCVAGSDRTEWKGVVVAPGYGFATEEPMKEKSDFVRMTFAFASNEDMITGIQRFGCAVDDLFTQREALPPPSD